MLSEVCEGEQGMQSRAFPSSLTYKATLMLKNSICDRVVMKANIHGSNTSEILKSKIPLLGREKKMTLNNLITLINFKPGNA